MKRFLVKILSICVCVSVFCCCFSCSKNQSTESQKPETEESFIGERYTLNVKYHALSDNVSQMLFDTEIGFSAYKVTRENYVFKGLEYCGVFYEYDSVSNTYGALGKEIQFQSAKVIDVTAVWECNLPQGIVFNMDAVATYKNGETTGKRVTTGTNLETVLENEQMYIADQTVYFEDKEGNDYFDTTTDIRDIFLNKYTNVVNYTGEAVSFTGVVEIYVAVDGNYITIQKGYIEYNFADSAITFQQIISLVKDFNDGSIDNVTNIDINFIYAK